MRSSYFGYGRVLPHQKFQTIVKTFVFHFLPLLIAANTIAYPSIYVTAPETPGVGDVYFLATVNFENRCTSF